MKVPTLPLSIAVLTISLVSMAAGQANSAMTKNNPYSPSPSGKAATIVPASTPKTQSAQPPTIAPQQIAFVTQGSRSAPREEQSRVEPEIVETESTVRPATNLYRIGVGDVVFVNLKNSPQGSGYYTVRENGEIDYPLAGPTVLIENKTTDEAAAMLRSAIKLFANPQVEVKVQYYLSRSFTVEGLANNPGEKILRREAMPIFAIRAESEVRREAATVRISRGKTGAIESYALSDASTDNVLVLAGDRVQFFEEKKPEVAQYTFAGKKKPLVAGTKLSQAIAEALGQKAEPNQAVIRRAGGMGAITISEYDVKSIKKHKALDPVLLPGDMIDIKN